MNNADFQRRKEQSWQRDLTAAEEKELQSWLAENPALEGEWREEVALNQVLKKTSDIPVSSNFTARVLQAVALEEKKLSRKQQPGWELWRAGLGWVSRLATACAFAAVIGVGGLSYHQYTATNQRTALAQDVQKVSNLAALPADWLENFDTINRLGSTSAADEDLLAALQ